MRLEGSGLIAPESCPDMRPVSCCGKNPLGTMMYRYTVSAIVARVTSQRQRLMAQHPAAATSRTARSQVERRARSDAIQESVLSHSACAASKPRAHHRREWSARSSSEITMATESVMANSRNRRPTMPPISRIGMNTAISEMLIDITVKPISAAPVQRGLHRRHALLDVARDIFDHHDRVVHHESGRDGQRHQREIVHAVAEQIQHAEGPHQRHRHRNRWESAWCARCAERRNTTMITRPMEIAMVRWTSRTDARMVVVRSLIDRHVDRRREWTLAAAAAPPARGPPCRRYSRRAAGRSSS